MQDFKCITDTLSDIKEGLNEIQTTLEEALEIAKTVQNGINNEDTWAGEAQKVGDAFLDIVIKYHSLLTGTGEGPIVQAVEGLEEYLKNDAAFYDEWIIYQQVNSM